MNNATPFLTVVTFLFLLPAWPAAAGEREHKDPFIQAYDDMVFLAGVPVNETVSRDNVDTKFQFGLRTRTLCSPGGWDFFFGYRQLATWNILAKSGPFRDVIFRPGFYFRKDAAAHTLTAGIEHFSNGRPFAGSPIASEDYDDGSRGLNYLMFQWRFERGANMVSVQARAGVGCGVGSCQRHNMMFTQDLLLNYLGYVTVEYACQWNAFGVHASAAPVWNSSIANIQIDTHWNYSEKWPGLYLEFHYGYDEALCNCRPDARPLSYIRLGLKYSL